jgi:hypothetical protein
VAGILKQQYDIVVLEVRLLPTRPNVQCTLQAKVEGELSRIKTWVSDTSDIGLPRDTKTASYADVTGTFPREMMDDLREWIASRPGPPKPLWVHLVKPYDVLRFIPWERALGDALPVPILMLPDFLFPPLRETESALEVALCGSAPLDHEEHWVHEAMRALAHRILEASPRTTRLHIFADSRLTQRLRDEFSDEGRLGSDVLVYGPEGAKPFLDPSISSGLVESGGTLRSPWLRWMRAALSGHSIDIVHFACHGYLRRDRGALLFAQSPLERTDRYVAGPVGQTELVSFLTQTGAWSTAFTSVFDDNSEPGLRELADGIAQSRPGPLLLHTIKHDPTAAKVVDAYRFLYSIDPMDAPKSSALFMYCQPHRIRNSGVAAPPRRVRGGVSYLELGEAPPAPPMPAQVAPPSMSAIDAMFKDQTTVPSWVAATERYVEQVQLNVAQAARTTGESGESGDETPDSPAQATLDLAERLRGAVARVASQDRTPPSRRTTSRGDA